MKCLAVCTILAAVLVYLGFREMADSADSGTKPKPEPVLCYLQVDEPKVVVCPDGRAYWHDVGPVTPKPSVPAP